MSGARTHSPSTTALRGVVLGLALSVTGCTGGVFDWSFMFPDRSGTSVDGRQYVDPLAKSAAFRDTVSQYAYLDGLRRLRVRTYGIVAGLGRNGSKQCPSGIRGQLIQEMYKTREFAQRRGRYVSPEQLIDDLGTAVVAVEGEIPSASPAGTRFDLIVSSFPGTQTTSLLGGWLYPCDLKLFRNKGSAGWIAGRTMANAAGPIFHNPFGRDGSAATKTNVRQGVIIGGGVSREDRRVRVLLTEPSYPRAISIADRINERFSVSTKTVADALSPSEIRLHIPDAYKHAPAHFLSVVQHLYLPANRPGFIASRTKELADEFAAPDAPHVEIALAWAGIGRTALSTVQSYYADASPARSFHSAVAGLWLGDDDAVQIIGEHLNDSASPYRIAAVSVLKSARNSRRASRPLRAAVQNSDPRLRIIAYEALLERNDSTIRSYSVGNGAFSVDVVAGDGSGSQNLIYAKRTGRPRIVLFGSNIAVQPPLFFALPGNSLIIDAGQGEQRVTLVRKTAVNGITSPPITCGVDFKELLMLIGGDPPRSDNEPTNGLGVDYGSIVLAVSEMCKSGAVNADFILESPDMVIKPAAAATFVRPES